MYKKEQNKEGQNETENIETPENKQEESENVQQEVIESKKMNENNSGIEDRITIYLDHLTHGWQLPKGVNWKELEEGNYKAFKMFSDDGNLVDRGVILERDLMQQVAALMGVRDYFKK